MTIYDINGNIILNPDLELGRLEKDKLFVTHHKSVAEVPEQWHYETIAQYPNGGKDVQKVIDTPYTPACEAWDEYVDIYRYVPYTAAELKEIETLKKTPTAEERLEALEAAMLEMMMGGTV